LVCVPWIACEKIAVVSTNGGDLNHRIAILDHHVAALASIAGDLVIQLGNLNAMLLAGDQIDRAERRETHLDINSHLERLEREIQVEWPSGE